MKITNLVLSGALLAALGFGQTASLKQMAPKSEKEQEAVMAVFNAADPAARISAVDALVKKFADTEFKGLTLFIAAAAAEELGDWEKTVIWADRALEADKNSYGTMLILARGYAMRTREFDLDKEEKLGKSEKYAKGALELLNNMPPKVNPQIPDEQWNAQVAAWKSEAYEALGLVATVRKKWDDAVAQFNKGLEAAPNSPNLLTRLGSAQLDGGKKADALATFNKVLALPQLDPAVKQVAENLKKKAEAN
ncbi:MAG: hypothetical protein OHK0021_22770 [Bryobacter sp.]